MLWNGHRHPHFISEEEKISNFFKNEIRLVWVLYSSSSCNDFHLFELTTKLESLIINVRQECVLHCMLSLFGPGRSVQLLHFRTLRVLLNVILRIPRGSLKSFLLLEYLYSCSIFRSWFIRSRYYSATQISLQMLHRTFLLKHLKNSLIFLRFSITE